MSNAKNCAKALALVTLAFAALSPGTPQRTSHAGAVSEAYEQYRLINTIPPYGLAKVRRLISRVKPVAKDEDMISAIPQRAFNALTIKEKFTYCMLLGEDASQNCAEMPATLYAEKRIFASPASSLESWSSRQEEYLTKHRGEVINLLRATMQRANHVGVNFKAAILNIGAWELIPDVTRIYERDGRDNDVPSLLCLLMKEPGYAPFTGTDIYRKLYGAANFSYKGFVSATSENKQIILKFAHSYWVSQKHK